MVLKACQNYLVIKNIETLKFRTSMGSSVDGKFALELMKNRIVEHRKILQSLKKITLAPTRACKDRETFNRIGLQC